jgi:hypothetical protein
MQSEVRGLTTMMQEIRNAIFPNASPLLPRSHVAALGIDDELASHKSALMLCTASSSPPRRKLYRGDG